MEDLASLQVNNGFRNICDDVWVQRSCCIHAEKPRIPFFEVDQVVLDAFPRLRIWLQNTATLRASSLCGLSLALDPVFFGILKFILNCAILSDVLRYNWGRSNHLSLIIFLTKILPFEIRIYEI